MTKTEEDQDIPVDASVPKLTGVFYAWVQVGLNPQMTRENETLSTPRADHYELRVITSENKCPRATYRTPKENYTFQKMMVRALKSELFPVLTCSLSLDKETVKVDVENFTLELKPLNRVNHLGLLGDTGCGECKKPSEWELQSNAENMRGDLFIHLGDFVYKKEKGPEKKVEKYADTWKQWDFEFLNPAQKLFAKAPLVFIRGNHESCKAAHEGYRRFFDPWIYVQNDCKVATTSYVFETQSGKFLVVDSATAGSIQKDMEKAPYQEAAQEIVSDFNKFQNELPTDHTENYFMLTHRTVWGCVPIAKGNPTQKVQCFDDGYMFRTEVFNQTRFDKLRKNILAVISGHIHLVSVTSYTDGGPLQIIFGNSTKPLHVDFDKEKFALTTRDRTKTSLFYNNNFPGYGALSPVLGTSEDLWSLELYKASGEKHKSFNILPKKRSLKKEDFDAGN